MPTTVRDPGFLLAVIREPSGRPRPESRESTISPGRCGQRPCSRLRSSSGPPGAARPTSVIGGAANVPPDPGGPGSIGVIVTSGNGPDDAVTPGSLPVAPSCAAVARPELTVATRWAPCWAANAESNGELESTT